MDYSLYVFERKKKGKIHKNFKFQAKVFGVKKHKALEKSRNQKNSFPVN